MKLFLAGMLTGGAVVFYVGAAFLRIFFADADPSVRHWGQVFKPWSK